MEMQAARLNQTDSFHDSSPNGKRESPVKLSEKDNIMKYFKKDIPLVAGKRKERLIKYDFKDPVLNKEFLEATVHHNSMKYRMKKDPIYRRKV